jgi:hypothetical protein
MIGPISEAKGKPKTVPPAATVKPEAKPEGKSAAKAEPTVTDEHKPSAKPDVKETPEAEPKSKSGTENASKPDPQPVAASPAKAAAAPPLADVKPQPKDEHAAVAHAS